MNNAAARAHALELIALGERLNRVLTDIDTASKRGELAGFFAWLTSREKPNPAHDPEDPESRAATPIDLATQEGRSEPFPGSHATYGDVADLQFGLAELVRWTETQPNTPTSDRPDPVDIRRTLLRTNRPASLR